uniref:Uncharacterized protein n=1 Tax=Ditylenchus dipsaci TaxID=166011 RepID=A0A915DLV7_9BILA
MTAEISISRILCDFLVLVCTALPLLIFHEFVTPIKRQLLIVVGILIPTMLILLTEVLRTLSWERRIASEFGAYRVRKYNVHRLIVRLYVFIGYFFWE